VETAIVRGLMVAAAVAETMVATAGPSAVAAVLHAIALGRMEVPLVARMMEVCAGINVAVRVLRRLLDLRLLLRLLLHRPVLNGAHLLETSW
jgi:hypothetical protein